MNDPEKYLKHELQLLYEELMCNPDLVPARPEAQVFFSPHEVLCIHPENFRDRDDAPAKYILICSIENAMLVQEVIDKVKKITGTKLYKVLRKGT